MPEEQAKVDDIDASLSLRVRETSAYVSRYYIDLMWYGTFRLALFPQIV